MKRTNNKNPSPDLLAPACLPLHSLPSAHRTHTERLPSRLLPARALLRITVIQRLPSQASPIHRIRAIVELDIARSLHRRRRVDKGIPINGERAVLHARVQDRWRCSAQSARLD